MKFTFPEKTKSLLMLRPDFFDVEYSINPFMQDVNGNLKRVDRTLAQRQWQDLKEVFEKLNLKVHEMPGQAGFPDMVFCANQSFPFVDPKTGNVMVLLSRMRAAERRGEVPFFETWFRENGYQVCVLETPNLSFEANGDLIPVPATNEFWGGVGPRTDRQVYTEIEKRFELTVHPLELVHSHFYHLDTCFFVVNKDLCAYVKEAFSPESEAEILKHFKTCLQIPLEEGLQNFAGNAFCPDGKNVIVQKGAAVMKSMLEKQGLTVIEVETGEYMKSGGSVFCMKLALPN